MSARCTRSRPRSTGRSAGSATGRDSAATPAGRGWSSCSPRSPVHCAPHSTRLRGSGYHHRHNGWNPPGARVRRDAEGREIVLERNPSGTYRARVDVQAADGTWHPKDGSSTFFPDNWHPQARRGRDQGRLRQPHAAPHQTRAGGGGSPTA
ncbi:EndoU domain-containing protein [Dactylosporangium sp. NPDC049742]|uniref:EndoU domain-containing protein n=1 Tax=Dactylosporangium sp. NPDC049742 TaxID=3154737 RepID=UPI00343F50BE